MTGVDGTLMPESLSDSEGRKVGLTSLEQRCCGMIRVSTILPSSLSSALTLSGVLFVRLRSKSGNCSASFEPKIFRFLFIRRWHSNSSFSSLSDVIWDSEREAAAASKKKLGLEIFVESGLGLSLTIFAPAFLSRVWRPEKGSFLLDKNAELFSLFCLPEGLKERVTGRNLKQSQVEKVHVVLVYYHS